MKPILFAPTATDFSSRGIGTLSDCASALVTEERNGAFELSFSVPITGKYFSEITRRSLVLAKPNPHDNPQPFRVYRQSKPMNGLVTFYARHISYDLDGIPVAPFQALTAAQAMDMLNTMGIVESPFEFSTDIVKTADMTVALPLSIRALMGGNEGSVLEHYGGEYAYDTYSVQLLKARGENRGVKFLYGKNLVDLTQEDNIEAVYTGVLPYWHSDADGLVQGTVQAAEGSFDFVRIFPLDLSDQFEDPPSVSQLNEAGRVYAINNKISTPAVSLSVSIVPPGSLGIESLEEVHLCDTVTVRFDRLGVDAQAKVISYQYDVLAERYVGLELGDRRTSIADTIVQLTEGVSAAPTKSAMQKAIQHATAVITGLKGGSVLWGFDAETGQPNELFFLDTDSKETARNVLRLNRNGIGFSTNGVNGPFGTAWTIDGLFYASYIVAKSITADKYANGSVKATYNGTTPTAAVAYEGLSNGAYGSGSVSYGKTSFTGTLDQVGVNKSDIAAIKTLFTTTLVTSALHVNGVFTYQSHQINLIGGYLRY